MPHSMDWRYGLKAHRSALNNLSLWAVCLFCLLPSTSGGQQLSAQASVVVYTATPSGIMAAIEAAHLGKPVILLEPNQHVGGMTSSGLGQTDSYDLRAIGGLAQTFFATVHSIDIAAGNPADVQGLHYEPHVAEAAFLQMLGQYPNIQIVYGSSLASVSMSGAVIQSITMTNGNSYSGFEFIDASYEGDLMAMAGVTYAVGRESVAQYGEALAGVRKPVPWAGVVTSPYVVPGDPSSGLIAHVASNTLGAPETADNGVMAYNYRLCISSDPQNQIPFTPPAGYNPAEFELVARNIVGYAASGQTLNLDSLCNLYPLPNNKFDLNVCTDDIGASAGYPTGTSALREQIADNVQEFDRGYLYFLLTDSRIPAAIQTDLQGFGLCKDEFTDNGGWPRQLYVREARRMVGSYVLTQADATSRTSIPDSIGLGGFQFDIHIVNQVAGPAGVMMEGIVEQPLTQMYPISYRILTPPSSQATNLLVPVAVSASHVGYSSLRVEPTFMVMGQAAGAAASLAIDEAATVQGVNYSNLSAALISDGQVLSSSCCSGPAAFLSQTSLAFGAENVGNTSTTKSIALINNGGAPLTIANIAVTGANASSFVFASTCGTSLAAKTGCTIHGHFTPATGGVLTAAITIGDNASSSPQTISLTGTGLAPAAAVKLSANNLSFGSEPVGTSTATQSVTLTNTGVAKLSIGGIQVRGASASSFPFSNNCGSSLAVGMSCSIHGHFTPAAGGILTAAVTITDNAGDSPETIALTGAGLTPEVSVSTAHNGNFTQGQQNAHISVSVTNNGPGSTYDATGGANPLTITDTMNAAFTYASYSGSGWTCSGGVTVTCSNDATIGAGKNYPALTLNVNVAATAASYIANSVSASGAGVDITSSNLDTVTVLPAAALSVQKSHSGAFTQGQTAEWDIVVTNAAPGGATAGTVSVSDTLPTGYTVNNFGATSSVWSCSGMATVTCSTTASESGGNAFPVIRAIVNVPNNSPVSVGNTAFAWGGGDLSHTTLGSAASGSDSNVQVAQVPASIGVNGNGMQATQVLTAFGTPPIVSVKDAGGNPVANTPVTFTAPASGASGTFSNGSNVIVVSTDVNGIANAGTFTANAVAGEPFAVGVTAGAAAMVNFNFTGVAGVATHLSLIGSGSAVEGTPFSLTLTALDASNNVATGYIGTVQFTSSDVSAMLPANTALIDGAGTFSATLLTRGAQTITATDTANNSMATTNSIAVTAQGFVVTSSSDDAIGVPSNCPGASCTLRDALAAAGQAGAGNITFDPAAFATATTIALSNGTLTVLSNTTITGQTSGSGSSLTNLVTVSGAGTSPVFTVAVGVTGAKIGGLTITNGGGLNGGGIYNLGILAVNSSTISGNSVASAGSSANGGGIFNAGTMTVTNSTVSGNVATGNGGGQASGGGIVNQGGNLTLANSTVAGNVVTAGNSGNGGGIVNDGGVLSVTNSTIAGNSADGTGGGIFVNAGAINLANTIVSANSAPANSDLLNAGGTLNDNGGNQVAESARGINLAPLGNYGGPTQTMLPLPGSTSICAGATANTIGFATGQRADPFDAVCPVGSVDAGAVQVDYAMSFTTQPPANALTGQALSPSPVVELTESGVAATAATNSIAINDTSNLVGGTLSANLSAGSAIFGNLIVSSAASSDVLSATLALTSSINLTAQAAVNVSVTTPAAVQLSTTALMFGGQKVGTQTGSQQVILTNTGGEALYIESIQVTGTGASSFVFSNNCGSSLPARSSCSIHGHFTPASAGALTAAIAIADSASGSPESIPLTGAGVAPAVSLSTASLSFGSAAVGTSTASQQVTLTNTGGATLFIGSIAVNGANASSFAMANNCGSSLAAGSSCSIHGHFAPVTGGALTAAITITGNAGGSPQGVALSGTGLAPVISLSANSISFGSVNLVSASSSQSVTLTNTGSATLTITGIAVTGTSASSFVFSNSCGTRLAPGAWCVIHGHFTPTTAGANGAIVTIAGSAPNSPQTLTLTGTGVGAPSAVLSATSISYGNQPLGTSSASQHATLTNKFTGKALTITSIVLSGSGASAFMFENSCGTRLAPGALCVIHGHFSPKKTGAVTADLTIKDDADGSPQSIALSGTGQ